MTTKTKKNIKKTFDFRTIKSFEDACKKENIDPNQLPDLTMIPEEFRKPLIAVYKLMIVFKAINDGWIADFGNHAQYKYYPWFFVSSGSGFGFSGSDYYFTHAGASVGSRLCTDSSEKALYIAEQFKQEYKDYLLYSK